MDADAVLASVGGAAYVWDLHSDAMSWSANAAALLGVEHEALTSGRAFAACLRPGNASTPSDAALNSGRLDDGTGVPYHIRYALLGQGDGEFWVEDTGRWFAGADGRPSHAHGVVRAGQSAPERVDYLAKHDKLTGEVNRWRLTELVSETLADAVRLRGSCAFLLFATDGLARINDAYGFAAADEVLAAVGRRIRATLRAGDILGRFSGNKFGVLLRNCSADEMSAAADRIIAGIRDEPVATSAGAVAVTLTGGGVAAPRHACTVDDVLARAQESLDAAKSRRPGSFTPHRPSVERDLARRENIRAGDEIVAALHERRVLVAFEPIVDAGSRVPALYECLMRLRRPDGTLASAASIIPRAERLGLVRLLDRRVLDLVVAEAAANPDIQLSLNVSPASTIDPDWWASLGAHLRTNPGIGERLIIEITEMAQIHDIDEARGFVSRAKDFGCRMAIDDFGAGFTSFRNLRKLGVDIIKIDGAFVQNLSRSQDDAAFVRALVTLGRSLGLKVVAEWVQDEAAAATLAQWGCHYLQGALFGLARLERPTAVYAQAGIAAA